MTQWHVVMITYAFINRPDASQILSPYHNLCFTVTKQVFHLGFFLYFHIFLLLYMSFIMTGDWH